MTCAHHLADQPDGLVCQRTDDHDAASRGGHVYLSTSGVAHAAKEEMS